MPGLHATAQGAERLIAPSKFRNGSRAFCVWGPVQHSGEDRVGADVEVLLLDVVDELVFLDVCEQRGLDLREGVQSASAEIGKDNDQVEER